MFILVYASTAKKPFSDGELLGWLHPFRERNVGLAITGLLLYKHGAFMQALEGEEEAVRALYATICEDKRHHCIITLVAMPVAKRQFSGWSMGFEDLGDTDLSLGPARQTPSFASPLTDELSRGKIRSGLPGKFCHRQVVRPG